MLNRLGHQVRQPFDITRKTPSDKRTPRRQCQGQWVRSHFNRTIQRGAGDEPWVARRRVLALGQAIDLIILDHVHDVQVAPGCVDKVAHPQPHRVAITMNGHHLQAVIGQLGSRRDRHRAPVQGHESIDPCIVGQLAAAADAADNQHLVRRNPRLDQTSLHGIQDPKVTTARAPRRLYRTRIILHRCCHAS